MPVYSTNTAFYSYYKNPKYSDFTITCGSDTHQVHMCYIAPQSKYFERCGDGMFKEGKERKIDLQEDDPDDVRRMIEFFYTSNYDDGSEDSDVESEQFPINIDAKMYALADKYDVPVMQALALEKFESALIECHTNRAAMISATETLTRDVELPDTDTKLHDLLVDGWLIAGGPALATTEGAKEFVELTKIAPWLSTALLTRTLTGLSTGKLHYLYVCEKCTRTKKVSWPGLYSTEGSNYPGLCESCYSKIPWADVEVAVDCEELFTSRDLSYKWRQSLKLLPNP